MKLGRMERGLLEYACRRRSEALVKAEGDRYVAELAAIGELRLRAQWGDPAKQADMIIMQHYGHAAPVKGFLIRVYQENTGRYETFTAPFATDLLIPDRGFGRYANENPGEWYEFTIRKDDVEFAVLSRIIEFRDSYKERMQAESRDFAAAIRRTSSYAKIVAEYPWLNSDEYRMFK